MAIILNTCVPKKRSLQKLFLGVKKAVLGQKGAFSPFIFGLMFGVSAFSVLSQQWARQDLKDYEKYLKQYQRKHSEDMAKALAFAMMAEQGDSHSDQATLERALQYTALSSGKTIGENDIRVMAQALNIQGAVDFGELSQKIAIVNTDDKLTQAAVAEAGASNADLITNGEVVVIDTSPIRRAQIETSIKQMEMLAEQLYAFFGNKFHFPDKGDYDRLRQRVDIKDAWGNDFRYERLDEENGFLEFTAPWGYKQTMRLGLKNMEDKKQEKISIKDLMAEYNITPKTEKATDGLPASVTNVTKTTTE